MIKPRTPRREQLGEFLTGRRRAANRTALGLPVTARRAQGLSREEIATLAGVSATWYTWLEQGRDINVSRQVLAAVSRVLGLSDVETEFVVELAEGDVVEPRERDGIPEHLQRLLDALAFPAFVVTMEWTIAGWNGPYAALYPAISAIDTADRNLLWLVYTDPDLRRLLPDWDRDSRAFLAEFRAESGVRLGSPRHRALIERLSAASSDFRVQWAEMSVERFASRVRTFNHAELGLRSYEHHRLVPAEAPDLHVVMYVPVG